MKTAMHHVCKPIPGVAAGHHPRIGNPRLVAGMLINGGGALVLLAELASLAATLG
jgi:hypothetical protein